jgi:hypothetical protein
MSHSEQTWYDLLPSPPNSPTELRRRRVRRVHLHLWVIDRPLRTARETRTATGRLTCANVAAPIAHHGNMEIVKHSYRPNNPRRNPGVSALSGLTRTSGSSIDPSAE